MWNGSHRPNSISNYLKRLSAPIKDDANHEDMVGYSSSCYRGPPNKLLRPH